MNSSFAHTQMVPVANSTIESLADADPDDIREWVQRNELDLRRTVNPSGDTLEIIVTTGVGGPRVEIELSTPAVQVYWGSDEVRRFIDDPEAQEFCEALWDHYKQVYPAF